MEILSAVPGDRMSHKGVLAALLVGGTILTAGAGSLSARRVEITPSGGFQFGGVFRLLNGDLRILSSANFGLSAGFHLKENMLLELAYSRQETGMEFEEHPSKEVFDLFNMAIEYYQLGFVYHFGYGTYVPFGTFSLGTSRFDPYETGTGSEYFFTIGGAGGVKIFISEHIGFRFQARLLIPFQAGSDLFCREGECRIGVSSGTGIAQGELSGGLVLRF
jgi:hypothetical protein